MIKAEHDPRELVAYDVKLPSRFWLKVANRAARVAILTPLAMVLAFFVEVFLMVMGRIDPAEVQAISPFSLTACVVLAIGGGFFEIWTTRTYKKYYERVRQGYVVGLDDHRGSEYSHRSDEYIYGWCARVYGYTYANELTTSHHEVGVDEWRALRVGQLVDYR